MRERAGANFAQATQLADEIVKQRDLPFRTAHRIVGKLVRTCLERGVSPAAVTSAMVDEAAVAMIGRPLDLPERTVRAALDVAHILKTRTLPGSPGAREVRRMLRSPRPPRGPGGRLAGCAHAHRWTTAKAALETLVTRLAR